VPLPDEQLEKLRLLRLEHEPTAATVEIGEVWEVPKHLVAFVVEGKTARTSSPRFLEEAARSCGHMRSRGLASLRNRNLHSV
jgi:hypothetical protein